MKDQNKSFSKQNVFESIVYYIDKIVNKMQRRIVFLNFKKCDLRAIQIIRDTFCIFWAPAPCDIFIFKKLFFHT